jgi:hypothetical protein
MRKKTRSRLLGVLAVVAVFASVTGGAEELSRERAAESAALEWLTLVDEGKYAESWEETAEYFKNAVGKGQWDQSMRAFRKPLGNAVERKAKSAVYATSLPGAPDGEYVVVEFSTSFENKKSATETVTPMMDGDGKWRVSGYYIK